MHEKIRKTLSYIVSPIAIMIILIAIYAIKGIYPFGTGSIAYYDMPQSMIPLYYHTWDVFHGMKSAFWDWYSGMGGSMADTMGNFVFNPFNLFFLFVKRTNITDSMSLFLIIKLMVAAFSMSFYVEKEYHEKELEGGLHIVAGMLYSACGFIVQYYTNIHFLDIVAIFPFMVYSYTLLVKKKRIIPYVLVMAIGFMTNLYLMYMVCIYLIYRAFFELRNVEKSHKKAISARLGLSTIGALGISSFSWIPMIMALLASQRVGTKAASIGYLGTLLTTSCEMQGQKEFMLYGSEWIFALILIKIARSKRKTIDNLRHIPILVLLILPIYIESINILWHMGGYAHFPMRFGYILTFEAICFLVESIGESVHRVQDDHKKLRKISGYVGIFLSLISIIAIYSYDKGFAEYGIRNLDMYKGYWLIVGVITFAVLFSWLSEKPVLMYSVIYFISIFQICVGLFSFIGPQKEFYSECAPELLDMAVKVEEEFEGEKKIGERYKDINNSMITNYPFVTGLSAVSNWTWGSNAKLREVETALGYSISYTRLLDNGGTQLSDSVLAMDYVISNGNVNKKLYDKINTSEKTSYYKMKNSLPFAFCTPSKLDIQFTEEKFKNNNMLFSELTNSDDELIHIYKPGDLKYEIDRGEVCALSVEIPIRNVSTIYIYSKNMKWGFAVVENEDIKMLPYQLNINNVTYPSPFQNGIIECGTYEDDATITLLIPEQFADSNGSFMDDISIGVMDMKLLSQEFAHLNDLQDLDISFSNSGINVKGYVKGDNYLYIPVGYNPGWKGYYNGGRATIESGLNGAVIMIPVSKGSIDINLSFTPVGWNMGIIISSVTILFVVLYLWGYKKGISIRVENMVGSMAYPVVVLLGWGLIIYMYVLPLLAWVYVQLFDYRNML